MKSRHTPALAFVIVAAATVFFANLGGPRLWDRDEPRNAGCAVEMLQRGDWVTPVFNDELRSHKPVMLYWLMMSSYSVFGVNEFAARFWSAALAIGTVMLTYGIGRRLFGRREGLWAAFALSTTLMFDVAARAATPDSALIFFSTLAIWLYVVGTFKPADEARGPTWRQEHVCYPGRWWQIALMFAAMAGAVLTKGPVGLVLPTAVIGMFLLIVHQSRTDGEQRSGVRSFISAFAPRHFLTTCWQMKPVTALAIVALIAGPWYVLVGARTEGDWIRGFFFEHNLGRAMQAMEGHNGGILFYPASILIGFFPWSIFALPTLLECRKLCSPRSPQQTGVLFAACWVGVYVILFSIARTKLPSYITPCYPAVALLVGVFLARWRAGLMGVAGYWPFVSATCLGVVGVILLTGLPLAAGRYLPGDEWIGLIGVIPLATAVVVAWATWQRRSRLGVGAMAGGAMAFCLAMFALAPSVVDRHQHVDRFVRHMENSSPSYQVGSFECLEPSWVFYTQRPVTELVEGESQPARTRSWRKRARQSLADFLGRDDHFVITTKSEWKQLANDLPHVEVLDSIRYFLKDDELVLLRRVPDRVAARRP